MEPTKEDKPDFENMASNMMGNPRYMGMEEMDTHENIMLGMKRIWNHYVIPLQKQIPVNGYYVAQLDRIHELTHSIQERDAKIAELESWSVKQNTFIDKLSQENERLKSELDKATKLLMLDGQKRRLALKEINNLLHGINESTTDT
jgi:hypothetical protein